MSSADEGDAVPEGGPALRELLDINLGAATLGIGGVAPIEDDDVHGAKVRGRRPARETHSLG